MHSGRENSVRAMLVAAAVVRHRGVSKGGFGAFTLDGIEFAVFKQPRREPAQFGVVLDNQHRSTILLGLSPYSPPSPECSLRSPSNCRMSAARFSGTGAQAAS